MHIYMSMVYTMWALIDHYCGPDEIDHDEIQRQYDLEEWEYVTNELDKLPYRRIVGNG